MILTFKIDFAPGFTARKEVVIEQVENFIGISEMFATFKDLRILCHLGDLLDILKTWISSISKTYPGLNGPKEKTCTW